jgi:hypothetical protein
MGDVMPTYDEAGVGGGGPTVGLGGRGCTDLVTGGAGAGGG